MKITGAAFGVMVIAALVAGLLLVLLVSSDQRTTLPCGNATLVIEGHQPGLGRETLRQDCKDLLGR